MKDLATVEKIVAIRNHDGADALEIATVLGWDVIIKKGEYKVGDKVAYVRIDTVLQERPEYEFLRQKRFRIKAMKLRGELSYGIIFSLDMCGKPKSWWQFWKSPEFQIGQDVAKALGVMKYEKPVKGMGKARGTFPTDILFKTDEDRIQNKPAVLEEMVSSDREIYITVKADGQSITAIKRNGVLQVCSRNMDLERPSEVEGSNSNFWAAAMKYDFDSIPDNHYIQAELIGNKIQGNKHQVGLEIRVFNVGTCEEGKKQTFFTYDEMVEFCKNQNFPMAKLLYRGKTNFSSQNDLTIMADELYYDSGVKAEGIVVRYTDMEVPFGKDKPTSFKMVSPKYLLKNDE